MNYLKKRQETGFTLIELLVAMVIALIVLGAISSAFISQRKSYSVQEQVTEMTQAARSAMAMLGTEIRQAGYDPQRITNFIGIPYSASQLQVYADLNGDGATDDPNENIIYTYNSSTRCIMRNDVNTDNTPQVFVENVEACSAKYFEEDGTTEVNTSADNDKIRQIEVTLRVRTSKPDPDFSSNNGYRTYTLTSRITPINVGL
jgi:type IV pilus assembly protein PilW